MSDDNAYVESLFHTCKYRPDYPARGFTNIDDARTWVQQFARWYNSEHRHSGIVFVTPAQRHLQRWSRESRNWTPVNEIWLNPERQPKQEMK